MKRIQIESNSCENLSEICEECGEVLVLYMNNDPKHISIKSLEYYIENQIKIDLGSPYSPYLNPINM